MGCPEVLAILLMLEQRMEVCLINIFGRVLSESHVGGSIAIIITEKKQVKSLPPPASKTAFVAGKVMVFPEKVLTQETRVLDCGVVYIFEHV